MNLTLLIDEKEKTFTTGFVKARIFRTVLDMNERLDFNKLSANDLDEVVGLTCEIFDNQFSVDDFYDGLDVTELIPTILKAFNYVSGSADRDDAGKHQQVKSETS